MPTGTLYTALQALLAEPTGGMPAEPWTLAEVDIRADPGLARLYRRHVPVVGVEGRGLLLPPLVLDATVLRRALAVEPDPALWVAAQAARVVAEAKHARKGRPARLQVALVQHWWGLLMAVLGVGVALPWLAPFRAKLGWWAAADAIYTAYLFVCHPLPERSGYVFGWCRWSRYTSQRGS